MSNSEVADWKTQVHGGGDEAGGVCLLRDEGNGGERVQTKLC